MKKMVCELCGSSDFTKQDGMFVCQVCGCKYTVEDARNLMVDDGEAPAPAPAAPAASPMVENFLEMAKAALDANNNAEAETYSNKVIESDPRNPKAWLYKGHAAGWQTTGKKNRFSEAVLAWINAYKFSKGDPALNLEIAQAITGEALSIATATVKMELDSFVRFRSQENYNDITNTLRLVLNQLTSLKKETGVNVIPEFKALFAKAANTCAVNASDASDKDFGTERRSKTKYAWNRFTGEQDRCLSLLDTAYDQCKDEGTKFTMCKNYIIIAKTVRDSCSYTYSSGGVYVQDYTFTADAKKNRTEVIDKWEKRKEFHDPELRKIRYKSAHAVLTSKLEQEGGKAAFDAYWAEHADQKAALEAESASIVQQVAQLEASKQNSPAVQARQAKKSEISAMETEFKGLGLFKGKEKKALRARIEAAQAELPGLDTAVTAFNTGVDNQVAPLLARKQEIQAELTKSRGYLSKAHGPQLTLFNGSNPNLFMSPMEFFHYMPDHMPSWAAVRTNAGEEGANGFINVSKSIFTINESMKSIKAILAGKTYTEVEWVDNPNEQKVYKAVYSDDGQDTKLYALYPAYSPDSPIQGTIRFTLDSDFDEKAAVTGAAIVANVLYDCMPDASLDQLMEMLLKGFYSQGESTVKVGDLKFTFSRGNRTATVDVTDALFDGGFSEPNINV